MLKILMNIEVRELLRTYTNVGKAVSLSAKYNQIPPMIGIMLTCLLIL